MTIQEWLHSDKDFKTGVNIYCAHSAASPILSRSFKRKQTKLLEQKLAYEIRKLSKIKKPEKAHKVAVSKKDDNAFAKAKKTSLPPPSPTSILMHDLPEALRPVLERANNLYKQICRLKISLNELPKNATRKAFTIQEKIYHSFLENASCWREIDYWKEYGELAAKEKSKLEILTPDERAIRMNTLRVRINRIQNRIDKYSSNLKKDLTLHYKNKYVGLRKKAKKDLVQAKLEQAEIIKLRKAYDNDYQSC